MASGTSGGEAIKAGQTVEICSRHADSSGLYPVKRRPNGLKVYLAELDGSRAKVLYPGTGGLFVCQVNAESSTRSGKMTLPAEVLRPVKAGS
jgi:hypothetical protein